MPKLYQNLMKRRNELAEYIQQIEKEQKAEKDSFIVFKQWARNAGLAANREEKLIKAYAALEAMDTALDKIEKENKPLQKADLEALSTAMNDASPNN
ncbi:MAG: hypothetical protein ACRCXC_12930 [Legionella sp.]